MLSICIVNYYSDCVSHQCPTRLVYVLHTIQYDKYKWMV